MLWFWRMEEVEGVGGGSTYTGESPTVIAYAAEPYLLFG